MKKWRYNLLVNVGLQIDVFFVDLKIFCKSNHYTVHSKLILHCQLYLNKNGRKLKYFESIINDLFNIELFCTIDGI